MTELPREMLQAIRQAAELLREAKNVVALTGAGFSTPSGIPDFRSPGSGLWTRYSPMEVATLTVFRTHPKEFFSWLQPLAQMMWNAQPNPAHIALAQLEKAGIVKTIITQNIDGLHARAGAEHVLEVHGTLNTLTCVSCYRSYPTEVYIEPYIVDKKIPQCQNCGGILKPDIILFEEQLPLKTWQEAERASASCDLMLAAGTSLEVVPSATLPLLAVENGAKLIIINKSATYLDVRADLIFHEDVAKILPRLVEEMLSGR